MILVRCVHATSSPIWHPIWLLTGMDQEEEEDGGEEELDGDEDDGEMEEDNDQEEEEEEEDEEEEEEEEPFNSSWVANNDDCDDDFGSPSENTALLSPITKLTAAAVPMTSTMSIPRGNMEIIISPSSPCSSALDLSCASGGEDVIFRLEKIIAIRFNSPIWFSV